MTPPGPAVRDLSDTPFSVERLFVWAVAIALVVSVVGVTIIASRGRAVAPQLQSIATYTLGVASARIVGRRDR